MEKISRRELLKLMGLSVAGVTLFSVAGCERFIENPISQSPVSENLNDYINFVDTYCKTILDGHLGPCYGKLSKGVVSDTQLAWDFNAIVDGYKVLNAEQRGNFNVNVNVEYDYVGVRKGDKLVVLNEKVKNTKVIFKYKFVNGLSDFKQSPILKREVFVNNIQQTLQKIEEILAKGAKSIVKETLDDRQKTLRNFLIQLNY